MDLYIDNPRPKKARKRRRRNPAVAIIRRQVGARNPAKRNPPRGRRKAGRGRKRSGGMMGLSRLPVTKLIGTGLAATGGYLGTRLLTKMVLKDKDHGAYGFAVNALVGGLLGGVALMLKQRAMAQVIWTGAAVAIGVRAIGEAWPRAVAYGGPLEAATLPGWSEYVGQPVQGQYVPASAPQQQQVAAAAQTVYYPQPQVQAFLPAVAGAGLTRAQVDLAAAIRSGRLNIMQRSKPMLPLNAPGGAASQGVAVAPGALNPALAGYGLAGMSDDIAMFSGYESRRNGN